MSDQPLKPTHAGAGENPSRKSKKIARAVTALSPNEGEGVKSGHFLEFRLAEFLKDMGGELDLRR